MCGVVVDLLFAFASFDVDVRFFVRAARSVSKFFDNIVIFGGNGYVMLLLYNFFVYNV